MNYEKYSKERFDALGKNTPESRALADELENDVCRELHSAILPIFKDIIRKLNSQGHCLTPYLDNVPGELSYRDEPENEQCFLRLACDTVICSGFGDTKSIEEMEKEIDR